MGISIFESGGLSVFGKYWKGITLDTAVAKGTWTTPGLWAIDQETADTPIVSYRSTGDVATALTTAPLGQDNTTSDFYTIEKFAAATGGVRIKALGENAAVTNNYVIESYGGQADTTKSTAGRALTEIYVSQHDGANALANIAADGNAWGVRGRVGGADVSLLLLDEDGDTWQNGTIDASRITSRGHVDFAFDLNSKTSGQSIRAAEGIGGYLTLMAFDTGAASVEIARMAGAADPYLQIGRDDTGVAVNAITDMLVLQAGAGASNEAANFGLGISVKLGNAASQVEERASMDFVIADATDGDEDVSFILNLMRNGSMVQKMKVDYLGNLLLTGSGNTGSRINTGGTEFGWIRNYFYMANFTQLAASTFMHGNCFDGTLTSITGTSSDINCNIFEMEVVTQNLTQTIGRVVQVEIREPVITPGTDTITLACALYIDGAPTEGVTNAAIYVAAGNTNIDTLTHRGAALGFFAATPVAQQTGIAAQKINYATPDLDTEAEIITAFNTTNTAINALRTALNNLGLTTVV
uniref:Uncharacterized protein n=1 Tax=viral metagenome TaxID=1070528 RepID=A0A6M3KMJ8_9ZZZZ